MFFSYLLSVCRELSVIWKLFVPGLFQFFCLLPLYQNPGKGTEDKRITHFSSLVPFTGMLSLVCVYWACWGSVQLLASFCSNFIDSCFCCLYSTAAHFALSPLVTAKAGVVT